MKTNAGWFLVAAMLVWQGPAQAQEPGDVAPGGIQEKPSAATMTTARRDPERPGSLQFSFSALWLAASSIGSSDANLTTNDARGSAYRLFSASGRFESTAGLDARVGYQITRLLAVEGGLTYSRPQIGFTIANDAEGAGGFTASGETISQFFADASLVVRPMRTGFAGGRARPFLEFGAGYLRELHGQTGATSAYFDAETGQVYHVGGGLTYFFSTRPSGFVKAYGLRFDGRFYIRNGGFSFDASHPTTVAAGGGLVLAF